jgi:hypothetical protein
MRAGLALAWAFVGWVAAQDRAASAFRWDLPKGFTAPAVPRDNPVRVVP